MIDVETKKEIEILDITFSVQRALDEIGVVEGIWLIYSLHTTTGLIINEAEPALIRDILNLLEEIVPKGANYLHEGPIGNAHAHLRAILLGNSVTIPVERGRLVLGTWQKILFLEMDGPRQRRVGVMALQNGMKNDDIKR